MKLKSIRELKNLKNKQVLLRVDFNVPVKNGKVQDDWRIRAALPTLAMLRKKGAKIVIVSHLGRPKINQKPKTKNQKLTLEPVFNYLKKLVSFKVDFTNAEIGSKVLDKKIKDLKPGSAIMLENVRFYPGEEKNDSDFAKKLAGLADIFINDAFAVSHRDCASITGITKFLPSYAGLNLEKEVEVLSKVFKNPAKPMAVLIGGAKISSKIGVIKRLLPKSKAVLIGGALANDFLAAKGYKIGSSLYEKEEVAAAKELLREQARGSSGAPLRFKKIILPVDVIITNGKKVEIRGVVSQVRGADKIPLIPPFKKGEERGDLCPAGWKIVDIGPRTIKLFSDYIRKAQTIVWNGPMGYFEDPRFSYGTMSMAQVTGARSTGPAYGIVGGGETIEALRKSGMEKYIDWVSTGGGAMLEFLERGTLLGLEALKK